jgi:protoporphyrinogen oxidase
MKRPEASGVPHIVVLGAGPAGTGAAYKLRRTERATVTVLEAKDVVGGNAGSFTWGEQRLDYGSHRLHPASDPEVLGDIRALLGGELLDRPRHGRIRLGSSWIHFPLKPVDLLLRADRGFAAGAVRDMGARVLGRKPDEGDTFASVLWANLGPAICTHFYFPYARKMWGVDPEELSAIQARRRVSAGSFGKLIKKVLGSVPGLKKPGSGRYYYPRRSFGAITEAYEGAAREAGAEFRLGWRVTGLRAAPDGWTVSAASGDEACEVHADYVWSTVPISLVARLTNEPPPDDVARAARAIRFRSMILVYLRLPVDHFTEFDAHYFPSTDVAITRLSETKNYAALDTPHGSTTICAELPCSPDDAWWTMSDAELCAVVATDLSTAGVPLPVEPEDVLVRRLTHAYPIYLRGYEAHFDAIDQWIGGLPRFLSFGRQGLFAHDNTHHALAMAYAAVDCLDGASFDAERWAAYRREFESHVVED